MTVIEEPVAVSARGWRVVRLLATAQAVLWISYFVGVGTMLLLAANHSGGWNFWPFGAGDMVDPKSLVPGAGLVVHAYLLLITIFGGFLAAAAGVAGIAVLLNLRRLGERSLPLTISTALVLLMCAVQASPIGLDIATWVLD